MRESPIAVVLRRGAVLTVSVLLAGWSVPLAHAAQTPPPPPPPSNSTTYSLNPDQFSLMISPTRLVVGPDDIAKTAEFQVINTGQAPVPVTVQKRNFTGGADGSLTYQEDAPYAAADWITVSPATFEVAPGATQVVTTSITVPPAPEPGDHQVALIFLVPAGETSANIKINRGIGAPLYITVPGPIDDSASISGLTAPWFALRGPVDISASVHDTGTVHRDFRGAAPLVIDTAGTRAAFPDFTVMRGATRDISTTWNPPLVCICHPTVTIADADGLPRSVSVRVIVFPLDLLGYLIVAGLVIVLAMRWRRRRYRAAVARAAAARWNQPPFAGNHA
jgi:hypothetical protein